MSVQSNWCRCTSCHIGYGRSGPDFDLTSEESVDCLICHDTTTTYKKFPTDCGHPAYETKTFSGATFKPVDLRLVAQNVGKPSRKTCGACHFFGGGGDGVKHGDLDSSLITPTNALDVHMDAEGLNYSCTACHTTARHHISGREYSAPALIRRELALPRDTGDRMSCESCHGPRPHTHVHKLNDHTDKVACQTCHIPTFAREKGTMMQWDWSTAGRFDEGGNVLAKKDVFGLVAYHTKKGSMRWKRNVSPEYFWYNGVMTYTGRSDKIDETKVFNINCPQNDYDDPDSRIYPFKIHRGKQVYDAESRTLVVPRLFGPKGSGVYWEDYDWARSVEAGMAAAGLTFSGDVGFAETAMYWPITHMVAPKEQALACSECHSRDGRLARLSSFYIPGRDRNRFLDLLGWLGVGLALLGVGVHGVARMVSKGTSGRMSR